MRMAHSKRSSVMGGRTWTQLGMGTGSPMNTSGLKHSSKECIPARNSTEFAASFKLRQFLNMTNGKLKGRPDRNTACIATFDIRRAMHNAIRRGMG